MQRPAPARLRPAARYPRARALAALVLVAAACLPAPCAAASKAAALIAKGYQRELKSCQKKWKGILVQCKNAASPSLGNNCGIPRPTTSTTTTTTTTAPPPTCPGPVTTTTTSTTLPNCDSLITWSACGPLDHNCSCHHRAEGQSLADYVCADAGTQERPSYVCVTSCSTDADCASCSDDETAVCIGGVAHEPPRGACVSRCQMPSPTVSAELAPEPHAQAPTGCGKGTICRTAIEGSFANCKASARAKWQAIAGACKAAKHAKNPAACRQAIADGYASTVASVRIGRAAVHPDITCPDGFPIDCGTGVCCPADFPVCCTQTKCCPSDFPVCGTDDVCHQDVGATTTTTTTTSTEPDCGGPTTTIQAGECLSALDDCHLSGCNIFPSGVCVVRCDGGTLFCAGGVTSFEVCTTDADCPPAGLPQLVNATICVTPGSLTDTSSCGGGQGHCAEPCH